VNKVTARPLASLFEESENRLVTSLTAHFYNGEGQAKGRCNLSSIELAVAKLLPWWGGVDTVGVSTVRIVLTPGHTDVVAIVAHRGAGGA
jgi:hypothetical protein